MSKPYQKKSGSPRKRKRTPKQTTVVAGAVLKPLYPARPIPHIAWSPRPKQRNWRRIMMTALYTLGVAWWFYYGHEAGGWSTELGNVCYCFAAYIAGDALHALSRD
ncbi:hypothetical protein [Labilithrix luteola]|nr:hypothetical protein [Labilithrix luteola]